MHGVLIIEDEPAVRKELEWLIKQETGFDLLGSAGNVKDAVGLINTTQPQLVLMDIQLTDGTAFDVLNQLEQVRFRIIFITAFNHFAIKAIKYGALDYLLKPLDETELSAALQRFKATPRETIQQQQPHQLAIAGHQKTEPENLESHIVLHTMEYLQVLQLKEIVYCQSEGGYTNFFLLNGRKIMISKPLKYYDDLLPERWFLRPHQSFLVNIIYVDKFLKTGSLVLKDKTDIPVSSRKKDYILQRISQIS